MEIRRIEGVFLQYALETAQGLKAENISRQMNLRLLTTVPQALLDAFPEGTLLEGRVVQTQGRTLRVMLNNQELVAENLSDLEIKEGDQLGLVLEGKNPITLKIVSLQRRLNIEQVLQFVLDFQEEPPINLDLQKLQALVKNSGLFYERKLLDFLTGKVDLKSILEDTKAQLLSNIFNLAGQIHGGEVKDIKTIDQLFGMVLKRTENLKEIGNLLRTLYLENLNHWEYTQFVRFVESIGKREILKAIEKGDKDAPLILLSKGLKSIEDTPAGKSFSLAFERLKQFSLLVKDEELGNLLRSFFEAVEKEDANGLREVHKRLENFIEEGRRLLPFREKIEKDGLVWLQQLNAISQMQRLMVNEGTVVLPFKWEGHRGGMLIRTQKNEYRVFINLNYPEGFVGALLSSPKTERVKAISLNLYTNNELFYRKMEKGKALLENMLKEEGLQLRDLKLKLLPSSQSLKEVLKEGFYGANLYLVV
jgi:hypothetical protein